MLLALTGYARVGKDTAAEILREALGFQRVAFADPVKVVAGRLYGLPTDLGWWEDNKSRPLANVAGKAPVEGAPAPPTYRDLLIRVGMTLRESDPDFWLRLGLAQAKVITDAGGAVVITDCRFRNEAEAVVAAGGRVVRITRRGCPPQGEADFASDAIEPWSVVRNDGSLEELRSNLLHSIWNRRAP